MTDQEFQTAVLQRLDGIEGRLGAVENRLGAVENRLGNVETDLREVRMILQIDQQVENLRTLRAVRKAAS